MQSIISHRPNRSRQIRCTLPPIFRSLAFPLSGLDLRQVFTSNHAHVGLTLRYGGLGSDTSVSAFRFGYPTRLVSVKAYIVSE